MYPAGERGIAVRRVRAGALSLRVIESGPADGHVAVCVHGWSASVYSFAETIPGLARAGMRVFALDLPGHGLSDKPADDRCYSTERLADTVLAALEALGLRRYTLIAHSMGGAVALEIARRHGRSVHGLVLIDAVGVGRVPAIALLRLLSPRIVNAITPRLLTRRVIRATLRLAFGTRDRPTGRDVDEYWAPSQFDEYAWACRASLHRGRWKRYDVDELSRLGVPILAIEGARDIIVRGTVARAAKVRGASVLRVRRGGHLVLQECADEVNEAIIAFVRGLGARS